MEKYNILFLDFDGVINNSDLNQENDHLFIPDDFNQYNPILVKNIKTIIHEYNFKLVISSTWRKDYSIQKMNYILNEAWLKDEFDAMENYPKDFSDHYIKSFLDQANHPDAQYEEWYKWAEKFRAQYRNLGAEVDH